MKVLKIIPDSKIKNKFYLTVCVIIEDKDEDLIEFIKYLIDRNYLWYKKIFTYKPISGIYYIREILNNYLKIIE